MDVQESIEQIFMNMKDKLKKDNKNIDSVVDKAMEEVMNIFQKKNKWLYSDLLKQMESHPL